MQRRVREYRALLAEASENSSEMEAPTTSAQLYCLCRSSDCSQFMIACHHCSVQYHGRCVGVTEQAARFILQYACPPCRDKDPTLNVIYKVPDRDLFPQPKDDEETVEMQESTDGEDKHRKDRQDSVVEVVSDSEAEEKQTSNDMVKRFTLYKPKKKKRRSCMECSACAITEDCGVCLFCRDKPKFGGSGIMKQKCVKRRCRHLTHMPHTSATKRVQKVSKKKKKKKCLKDKHREGRLDSGVEVISRNESEEKQTSKHVVKKLSAKHKRRTRRSNCKECSACIITEDCGECFFCRDKPKFGGNGIFKQKCVKRRCLRLTPIRRMPYTSALKQLQEVGKKKKEKKYLKDRQNCKVMNKKLPSTPKKKKRKQSCKKCYACAITEDCGVCVLCRDMPKFGGNGHLRQKCVKRRCLRFTPNSYTHLQLQLAPVVVPLTKQVGRRRRKGVCRQCVPSRRPDCRKCIYCLDMTKYGGKGRLRAKCKFRRCDAKCTALRLGKQVKCQRDQCKNFSKPWWNYCSHLCEIRTVTMSAFTWMPQMIRSLLANCEDKQMMSELALLQVEVTAVRSRMVEMSSRIRELRNIVGRARQAKKNMQGGDQGNRMDCSEGITVVRESKLARFMNKRCKNPESIHIVGQTWGAEKIMKKADASCCCPLVPNLFDTTSNYCPVPQSECHEHQGWETLLKTEVELERVREWLWLNVLMEKLQDLVMMTQEDRKGEVVA